MRVKRLEIQGFKSFKDKTVIHFDEGITGIVGPNGCGKSNIVDAFFWVMGEQSYKHMRGTSSEDLIFNGSSKHTPLAMAEATLVLETGHDSDANSASGATVQDVPIHLRSKEVAVTRRVYRDGEGEYFINHVPARLKDIQELFMDTGVGAKGYSVIEQGQIGKIVNARPEDRRLLIEEAAGIAKYKARKKESLRKMEATHANLSRLNDIVQEIERNLASLERQAQKAKLYQKYKDELLDQEMSWGRRKAQLIKFKVEGLKRQKEALEQDLLSLTHELQIAENSIEVERVNQVTDTKSAEETQTRIQILSDQLALERGSLELSKQRQTDLSAQLKALENEKNDLTRAIESGREKFIEQKKQTDETETALTEAKERSQALDEKVRCFRQETETARRNLDNTKKELMQVISKAADQSSRSAALLSRIEASKSQVLRLEQQEKLASERLETVRTESTLAQTAARKTQSTKAQAQQEREDLQARIREIQQELTRLETEWTQCSHQVTETRTRLQGLEELAASYEGFGEGAKKALEWAKNQGFSEKLSSLADLFEVAPENEEMLANWLGNRIEFLLASDPGIAIGAIEHLKANVFGRAAVYMSSPQHSPPSVEDVRNLLENSGFRIFGLAAEFVQVNSSADFETTELAKRWIERALIVDSFQPMAEFLRAGGISKLGGWCIVSRNGDSLENDGTIHGGSANRDSAPQILRRKNLISTHRQELISAEERGRMLESVLKAARETLEQAKIRQQALLAEIQSLEIKEAALSKELHLSERTVRDSEGQLQLIQLELQEIRKSSGQAHSERELLEKEIASFAENRIQLQSQVENGESELFERETELRALEGELQSFLVHDASMRERVSGMRRELEIAQSLLSDREKRLNDIDRLFERAAQEVSQYSGDDSQITAKIAELTRELSMARENLSNVKNHLEESNITLTRALDCVKELHKSRDEKTFAANQAALEEEKSVGDLTHLIQNLEEKYGPGCLERPVTSPIQEEMPAPVITEEMTAEEERVLAEEIERLRERIRRLGEVNVMAIEEFSVLKERYDRLTQERGDLKQSIENLEEAIEHINKTSEERFKKAFEAISDRFSRLFPIIFGGGQAKLSLIYLENSMDALEAGVDILAQPPGKKVVNISLLSGGEKALTAVSLIFAIFMVKPSPFCVLDEVDAPLDDANIGKFNGLLREMSRGSQFILITHNKKTMELNDTLYGVTMEEPGVSKMVSIQMN